MAQVIITINSREYAIACDAGEEVRILQLSRILEEKAKMLTAGGAMINENMLLAMIGLLLADEISELKATQGGKKEINESAKNVEEIEKKCAEFEQKYAQIAKKCAEIDEKSAEKLKNCSERIKILAKNLEML